VYSNGHGSKNVRRNDLITSAHVQNLCKFLDSRLRGNDVMPVETGIQRGGEAASRHQCTDLTHEPITSRLCYPLFFSISVSLLHLYLCLCLLVTAPRNAMSVRHQRNRWSRLRSRRRMRPGKRPDRPHPLASPIGKVGSGQAVCRASSGH
jgi:hypothetical protein